MDYFNDWKVKDTLIVIVALAFILLVYSLHDIDKQREERQKVHECLKPIAIQVCEDYGLKYYDIWYGGFIEKPNRIRCDREIEGFDRRENPYELEIFYFAKEELKECKK